MEVELNMAICEMFTCDIKKELRYRQFELLDCTLDEEYAKWSIRRCEALKFELMERGQL